MHPGATRVHVRRGFFQFHWAPSLFPVIFILISILLFGTPLLARETTDLLVMKNGDRLTCVIKRLDAGVLYIGLDYVDGTISLQWSEVASIKSSQLFLVKTQGGLVYRGELTSLAVAADQIEQIQVAEPSDKKVVLDKSKVVDVRQTSEELWQRFNGDINMGIAYSKGNNATQFSFGSDIEYQRERWAAQTMYSSNLSYNSGANTSTRNMLAFSGYHLMRWDNYFYGGVADFLQSSTQGIRLQTAVGAGFGRFLKNTSRSSIGLMAGVAWQSTDYHQSGVEQSAQNVAAALIAVDFQFFKFKKTNLRINVEVFPAVSDPGRLRVNTNVSYYLKIVGDLSWTFSFYGNWDTRPPAHFSGSDYGSTSGVNWTFGK